MTNDECSRKHTAESEANHEMQFKEAVNPK